MIRIWTVEETARTDWILAEAASLIKEGGVLVYPTETFYALGGQAKLQSTIKRIFAIKGRAASKPLPLIAGGMPAVRDAVEQWPEAARRLAARFWPGPLTLLLHASAGLPVELHAGTGKIAVRISPHPLAAALANAIGGLLISTSANISGSPAVDHPDHIDPALMAQIDGMIRSGQTAGQRPSTIIDVSSSPAQLIREGAIPWELIVQTLQRESPALI